MKTLVLLTILNMTAFSTAGTYLFNTEAAPENEVPEYCVIVGTSKLLSNKVTIEIDYGQETKFFSDTRVRDQTTGKLQSFNSMADALNWMAIQGWHFEQAYTVTTGNQNVYNYLLKR